MIGQSVVNVSSGARGRLSTLLTGVLLLVFLVVFHGLLAIAPVAGLTAVMIMVSINTFSWKSLADLRRASWRSSAVIAATMLTVLITQDLFRGVMVGALLSRIFFDAEVSSGVRITSRSSQDGRAP